MNSDTIRRVGGLLIALTLLASGCAGTPDGTPAPGFPPGYPVIEIKARNYSFTPSAIRARAGDVLTLSVENLSGKDHNLTIEAPGGRTLRSLDLPAGGTKKVEVAVKDPGRYSFYCDLPFHSTLGMKGTIEAE